MNKQQLYTFGGALLASTALSGGANAIEIGTVSDTLVFTTTPVRIANTLFSTTASTANAVQIETNAAARRIAARFSNQYNLTTIGGTGFSVTFNPTNATFLSGSTGMAKATFMIASASSGSFVATIPAATICAGVVSLGNTFTLNGCTVASGTFGGGDVSLNIQGIMFTGVVFTNASALANAGSSISLTGTVFNTATQATFEAAATGAVLTSAAPVTTTVTAAANTIADATTTPTAFSRITTASQNEGVLTMNLVTVVITNTGAFGNGLTSVATATGEAGTATVTVSSTLLSSGAVSQVRYMSATPLNVTTAAVFTGGSITFNVADADMNSFTIRVHFNGTTAIPEAAAGTVNVVYQANASAQAIPTGTGATAAVSQGGFRSEVNSFNSTSNGAYNSYLRVHNNGSVAGTVNITVFNGAADQGGQLGQVFTTSSINSNSTLLLTAAQIEAGANIPMAERTGAYTLKISGPILGYVQHYLFDGEFVVDMTAFRNAVP